MTLYVEPDGTVRGLYGEEINLAALGILTIRRASHVEADEQGRWWVDLGPVSGPRLGPFQQRSLGLLAENAWLEGQLLHDRNTGPALSQGTVTRSSQLFMT